MECRKDCDESVLIQIWLKLIASLLGETSRATMLASMMDGRQKS